MSENTGSLRQEIDALIAELGENASIAKPAAERAVLNKIRLLLDSTRDQRTGPARLSWETYLPYAARLCQRLSRLEEGWAEELDYFASENSQFWLDCAAALLESGEISGVKTALERLFESARMMKQDPVARADVLLQALDIAVEISDKKQAVLLYEEAEKTYRNRLVGGSAYTGSAWAGKIKKMGQRLDHYGERLRRYFHYAESVTVSIEASSAGDLERALEYLQQNLVGKIKVTRRAKEADGQEPSGAGRFRARIKITLE